MEILAPAGCMPSLQAALDAGADAIFFGVAQLNMRAKARRTFQPNDIAEVTRRAHAVGVQVNLCVNTLLYDHDLRLADRLLDLAVENGVDAVIVADVAAMTGARDRGLEAHLSTQLSVSNYRSFRFYSQWVDRIVLARELSLPMVKRLHDQVLADDLRGPSGRPMEIECFGHGALCIAVSGRCGMSLYTDNASGNRGACTQNCRREYIVTDKQTGVQLEVDNHLIMSPNDISTIGFLDQVAEAGVAVLKLEGRGRSPEYVATVTRVYREAIDALDAGTYTTDRVAAWRTEMSRVYNRGFSSGFYLGRKQGWAGADRSQATEMKVFVGDVVNYYSKAGVAAVAPRRGASLERGDRFVIIGPTTGVVEGQVDELRHDAEADQLTLPVKTKVRRSDKLYVLRPVGRKPAIGKGSR